MKPHRKRKWIFIILAAVAVVAVAASLFLPRIVDLNSYRGPIAARIQEATGGEVSLGRMSWRFAGGLQLQVEDLTIRNAAVFPGDIDLPRLFGTVSILPLFKKDVVVQELRLEHPVLALRIPSHSATQEGAAQPPAATPFADAPSPGSARSREGSPPSVTFAIRGVRIEHGRIDIEDSLSSYKGTQAHRLDDVNIKADNLVPGERMTFQFSLLNEATPGLGSLKGQGTFAGLTEALTIVDPQLNFTATLQKCAVGVIKPYLEDTPLAQRSGGSVSLVLNYAGDLGQHFDAKGHIDLSEFTYTDSSLWTQPLPGSAAGLTYEIKLDPDHINLAQADLALGDISILGQVLIEDWRQQPTIKNIVFKGKLPLAGLERFLPQGFLGKAEGIVRELLQGGGELVVERLGLPDIAPARLLRVDTELIEGIDASLALSGISFRPSPASPKLTKIAGNLKLQKGELKATNVSGLLGPLTLPTVELHATNLTAAPKFTASAMGPLHLIHTDDPAVEQLLMRHGLGRLSGDATVDLQAHYDTGNPTHWDAAGSLDLKGFKAETYPGGVLLEELVGRVSWQRSSRLDLNVEHLTGRVNQSQIEIDGKIADAGAETMVLKGRAKAGSLDLAHFANLVPALKAFQVNGKLNMDLEAHYSRAKPVNARVTGKVKASGLAFRWNDFLVEEGEADITLSGQTMKVGEATLRVNDQVLHLSGQLTGLNELTAELQLQTPNLDVDRLLRSEASKDLRGPSASTRKPAAVESGITSSGAATKDDAGQAQLPALLRKSTATIVAEVAEGRYRGHPFRDLRVEAVYKRGAFDRHKLDVGITGGRLNTQGSVDLSDLAHISFDIEPDIDSVPLESISRLIGLDDPILHGPFTVHGRLRGHTGSREETLTSLNGTLAMEVGPGQIQSKTFVGDRLLDLLSFIHLNGLLSGKARDDFATGGIPYDAIKVKAAFQDGGLKVDHVRLAAPALTADSTGTIDLVGQRLKMHADVEVLKNADEVLGFVPLVGTAAKEMTEVHLDLEGPFDRPEMSIVPGAGLVKGIEAEVKQIGRHIKGIFKRHSHHPDEKTSQ